MPKVSPHRVGSHWLVSARSGELRTEFSSDGTNGWFDELVVDNWLHIEWMNGRNYWARIGDAQLSIHIKDDGSVDLKIERGFYENDPDLRLRRDPARDDGSQEADPPSEPDL